MNPLQKLTTARLYWVPLGQAGYIDFGNLVDYKSDPKIQRIEHQQSMKGFRQTDMSVPKSIQNLKVFTLDEHFAETIKLQNLGSQLADVVQNAANALTVTIPHANIVAGRTYDLGKLMVSNVAVVDHQAALPHNQTNVAPSQYVLDAGSGMITFLTDFVYDAVITFNCDAVTQMNFDRLSNLLSRGFFKLLEFDQFDEVPYGVETFNGQCQVTGWGENNLDKFNEYTLEVLITG